MFVYGAEDRADSTGLKVSRVPDADVSLPLTRPERGSPSLGSPSRDKEVKIEEVILLLLRKYPGGPDPEDVEPSVGIVPDAVRRTEDPRPVVHGTAPQYAHSIITSTRTEPFTPINYGVFKDFVPAVFYPFTNITDRFVHPEVIRTI